MSKWVKKGDQVLVIAGNDKGKMGEVLRKNGERVVVQGVSVRKKHLKRRDQNAPSEIIDIETPIHISNVAICDQEGNRLKLRVGINEDGSKELYYKKNDQKTVYRTIKKSVKES
ncbi:MAG: 50S ribosomal protein L24 [Simkaniaceae bacterium]